MSHPYDYPTFLCTVGFIIANAFAVGLWAVALCAIRLRFFWILLVASGLGFLLAVVNCAIYYDPRPMPDLLGSAGFKFFFYCYTWALLLQFVATLVGLTIMVRWIWLRVRPEGGGD